MNYIREAITNWGNECYLRFNKLKSNDEELNCIFIDIYGLRDELTPEVEDNDVAVRKAAELNLSKISDKLNEEFAAEERSLVFWFDDNADFENDIDSPEFKNTLKKAKLLRFEKDNQLYIKYFLEVEDTETSYLIYVPFPKPDIQHNHLAGTIHYSKGFFDVEVYKYY